MVVSCEGGRYRPVMASSAVFDYRMAVVEAAFQSIGGP